MTLNGACLSEMLASGTMVPESHFAVLVVEHRVTVAKVPRPQSCR